MQELKNLTFATKTIKIALRKAISVDLLSLLFVKHFRLVPLYKINFVNFMF